MGMRTRVNCVPFQGILLSNRLMFISVEGEQCPYRRLRTITVIGSPAKPINVTGVLGMPLHGV